MSKKQRNKSIVLFLLGIVLTVAMICVNIFGVTVGGKEKGSVRNIKLGLDLKGGVSVTYQAQGSFSADEFQDTIRKMALRAEKFSTEADVYQEGDDRITIDIPAENDADAVLEKLGKPGSLTFVTDSKKVWQVGETIDSKTAVTWFSGADMQSAEPKSQTGSTGITEYVVAFKLNDNAAKKFEQVTSEHINEILYVVYDGKVISAPYIKAKLTGGEGVITGMASYAEAEELADTIGIGSLGVELEAVSSKVVSAKLGEDAISTSLQAGLIGILIVIIFMMCAYRIPGFASGIALIIYTSLTLICINGFNWTLTLPGIAGVILSIGMAVDANVIIFARIKEELAECDNLELAIKTGFKKSTSAILDGNITTLIAAIVLMSVGSGTIKGFAQTLALGIVLSMITALFVTRVILMLLYRMGFNKKVMYGIRKQRKSINFLGKKIICFSVSIIVIAAGIVGMIMSKMEAVGGRSSALNYSVEFKGGLSTTIDFKEKYDIEYFNDNIMPDIAEVIGDNDILTNAEADSNRYIIRTKDLDAATKDSLKAMLEKNHGAVDFEETTVSASTSSDMRNSAIISVVIATFFMLIYIFIRFRDIKFASSAVMALIHDVLIVLTFYALSWSTVGNTFIACMLTIVGYSINATIVIFDRIRENITIMEGASRKEIVNASITQTLTRSIYTSFTTLIMVLMIFILGVTSIKEFALPLMIGIVAGGYSSVFITGALWYIMGGKKNK